MSSSFQTGQRWVSTGEPELGLGTVVAVAARTLTLRFPASGETREYARAKPPLQRARFAPGDEIRDGQGCVRTVARVEEQEGLLLYHGEGWSLPEAELDGTLGAHTPEARLRAGQADPCADFDLRVAALNHQRRRRASPLRGLAGGRIELIPHQLGIAHEVAGRLAPRVLLADEVGLGKTIEAGLILHRLVATGRVKRALILVPESLVHQWFVELLRRFNLRCAVYDEARCGGPEAPGANPFLDEQIVLCALGFLSGKRLEQAQEAGWDLLVVDEAHHLGWSPEGASPEYAAVEALAGRSTALLLLTATPEQLGMAGHFARLRLLDPARHADLDAFLKEAEGYGPLAELAARLIDGGDLHPEQLRRLAALRGEPEAELRARLETWGDAARRACALDLVDHHGTGRVLFRHTRAAVQGFPRRVAHLAPLDAPRRGGDPRVAWLAQFLRDRPDEKVLAIVHSREDAEALEAALHRHVAVKTVLFHEGLSLVQRDRGAAWFTEAGGARLLISSEIGSEGRNFQAAHHLVLLDLPKDPALLEQRIGRLDRIGQREEVHIHVPYQRGSAEERLARWYHEGLGAFEAPVQGAEELRTRFGARLDALLDRPDPAEVEALLAETRRAHQELRLRLEQGRDRLLELGALRPERAEALVRELQAQDADRSLEDFLLAVLEQAGIEVEELAPRTYRIGSAEGPEPAFPGLPATGLAVTCDRTRALAREDLPFLSWDHPMASGALDLVLASPQGNSAFARWPDEGSPALYLEAIFVLEAVAPTGLHADRFLPPTPLRVLVDHQRQDLSRTLRRAAYLHRLQDAQAQALLAQPGLRETLLPRMVARAHALAQARVPALVEQARKAMADQLSQEEARLEALRRINPGVRLEEIELIARQRLELDRHLATARLRPDALRLIHRGRGA